mmetsp:Transcript_10398/g.18193  ORF Transcript_10398/g.18193 Transcript_10398/m.18193 type:complete len:82 (+) Transcript_10398:102-347(+)
MERPFNGDEKAVHVCFEKTLTKDQSLISCRVALKWRFKAEAALGRNINLLGRNIRAKQNSQGWHRPCVYAYSNEAGAFDWR